jgi:serine/threonine protein kinase/formylglycine-generating enzyme required for sulfatase activity
MDRLEVLKVVNKALLDHPGAVERFLREIRAAAKLSHANVVAAYSAVQQGELLAFAMEYVEGQDLASLVKTQGPLPIANGCFYVQQAALGLQHAFEKQMVHRDIKPQNFILAREGKKHLVKVLDFGLAKVMREKTDDTGLTGEGRMLGTPDYIAPEQTLDAAKADIRADIYSLGCTLYFLLCGSPPFRANSLGAILLAHQMQEAKPLNLVRPEVPEELAAVVRKMMAKSPTQRYQTPREVVQALAPFIKPGAAPKSVPELSIGAVEPKPAVKKTARLDPPSAPVVEEAEVEPEEADVKESPRESRAPSVEARRSGKFSAVAIGSQFGQDIPNVAPRKKKTVRKRRPAAGMSQTRKKWLIGSGLGVGVLLLALLGMWAAGVFKVKTQDGILVVEVNEANPDVFVDGEKMTVSWDNGGKKAEIRVKPGTFKVEVKKDGFTVSGAEVTVESGGRNIITASLSRVVDAKLPATFTNSVGMEFVLVPKGKSWLGGGGGRVGDQEVEIQQDFYLGKYEVTQGEWELILGKNPSYFSRTGAGKEVVKDIPDADLKRFPVETVSWKDCQDFIYRLKGKLKESGWVYRLPKEIEWEYACRGGPMADRFDSAFHFYLDKPRNELLPDQAIFGKWPNGRTCKVGSYKPNRLGLFDMHGNVFEWCEDAVVGGDGEAYRVLRGGSWDPPPERCQAVHRYLLKEFLGGLSRGLRLARVPVGKQGEPSASNTIRPLSPSPPSAQESPSAERPPETWLERVKSLPVQRVPDAVADRLRELNPDFDGKIKYAIEKGQVVSLEFVADAVRDISPVQALSGLRKLHCRGSWWRKGKLADLTPLKGLKLTELFCDGSPQVTDLSPLRGMPLTRLFCAATEVTDLSPLKGMNLMELDCGYGSLSDLSPLKEVKLTRLHCYHCKVTDASLVALQQVPGLRNLEIAGEGITDAGLAHVSKIPELEHFEYGRAKFTGKGLIHFKGLTKLRHLKLFDAPVKDNALVHVEGLVGLREFGFDGTPVSDAGLEHLTGLRNLVWLDLRRTKVTEKGVAKLQAALPKCRMIR